MLILLNPFGLGYSGRSAATRMITIAEIKSSPTVVADLEWPFDFSLSDADDDFDWVQLKPATPFAVIAGEGTGGVFLVYGTAAPELLPVLYGTSEGQAGKVASNLTEWLAILMAIPYWQDLLKFSGSGNLDEMRKTAVFIEKDYAGHYADLPEARKRIMRALPIPTLDDPIKVLHDNVHATDHVLVAEDGYEFESLFHTFKSSDNPNWR